MSIITDNIGVAKSVTVDLPDTPLDGRTRCDSIGDFPNIEHPFVGMQIYTISDGKTWVVKSLRENKILTYEEFGSNVSSVEYTIGNGLTRANNILSIDFNTVMTEEQVYNKFGVDMPNTTPLTFTAEEAGSTITLNEHILVTTGFVQYRYGTSGEWSTYECGTALTLENIGDKVQFQHTKDTLSDSAATYAYFSMTGKIAASGNIQSMLNYSESCSDWCYYYMFKDCSSLTKAPELPATTLADNCYQFMFYGCYNLTSAPELPATTLAEGCYSDMFYGCANLTEAPELPAITLADYCYSGMFDGCGSLTSAPTLPATTLAEGCYLSMFNQCYSLHWAPELPATTLADRCYESMFYECRHLSEAPELPATTLTHQCYARMFYGCTWLTKAPELPATTLVESCYLGMFAECTNLNYISVKFTDWDPNNTSVWDSGNTYNWVDGVSSTGTFIKPTALPEIYGTGNIPEGWTVENH